MTQRLISFLSRTDVWVGALALAAFLALYWVLRGAPIGQAPREDQDEPDGPGARYRDRVVGGVVAGILLIVAGATIAATRSVSGSLPVFALGFGLVLALVAINQRYRHTSPTLRRTVELSNAALTAALVAGILTVINVLAFRYGGQPIDLTREGAYTLSSLTLNQLKALKRPVRFTILFGRSPIAVRQLHRIQQLIDLYKSANPSRIGVEYINPFADVERFDALKKRMPNVELSQAGGILVEYGEGETTERLAIPNNDLFSFPESARTADPDRFISSFKGEDAVTSALIRLREGKRWTVVFTTGHGETSTAELEPRKPGIGLWANRLTSTGSNVTPVNLIRDNLPDETSLVIVAAPKTPFQADEVAKLKRYADKGGPLLLILGAERNGLDEFLKSYNLAIGPGTIVDPRLNYRRQPMLVFAPVLRSGAVAHPVVDPLVDQVVLVPNASPIEIIRAGPGTNVNMGFLPAPILQTSRESWAETDLTNPRVERGKDDKPGPLNVGVAVVERLDPAKAKTGKPRMVLFSSRFLADNFFIEAQPTNLDLLMNAIEWLRGRSELGGIAPKTHTSLTLVADPILRTRLALVPSVMAVLIIISLGLIISVARRE